MKRVIKAARLVDTFLKYHDDENNWASNQDGFEKMYKILEKYDDSNGNDTVDVAFLKATPEDQQRMIELITPSYRVGDKGYVKKLYKDALAGEFESREYCEGIIDAIKALFAEGLLERKDLQ